MAVCSPERQGGVPRIGWKGSSLPALAPPSPRQAMRTLCRPSAACSLRGLAHPHTLPGAGSPTWAELGRCVGCVYPLCKWHNTTGNEDHAVRGAQTLLDLPQKRKETCQAKR